MVNIANFLRNKNKSPHRGLKLNCLEFLLTFLPGCDILSLERDSAEVAVVDGFEASVVSVCPLRLAESLSIFLHIDIFDFL